MKTIFVLVASVALVVILSCQKEVEPTKVEVWNGSLKIYTGIGTYLDSTIDTVSLTIDNGFYELRHSVNDSRLCNTNGRITNFGKPETRLTPSSIIWTGNCDSLRVPSGLFRAVFSGNNLTLTKDTSSENPTWSYYFDLKM